MEKGGKEEVVSWGSVRRSIDTPSVGENATKGEQSVGTVEGRAQGRYAPGKTLVGATTRKMLYT